MAYYCFLVASEFASSFAFFVQLQSRVTFYACLMKHNLGREGDPGWECPRLEDPGLRGSRAGESWMGGSWTAEVLGFRSAGHIFRRKSHSLTD